MYSQGIGAINQPKPAMAVANIFVPIIAINIRVAGNGRLRKQFRVRATKSVK
jgi:hypothetical protein